jgi:hypothetical protein
MSTNEADPQWRLPPDEYDLPTVALPAPEQALRVLRQLQVAALKHPAAAKAAFGALVAEGRAFAQTPEGTAWRDRLAGSALLHRARLVFDFPGLSMLQSDRPDFLPSAYVDAIFMLACSDKPADLLDSMFRWEWGDDRR